MADLREYGKCRGWTLDDTLFKDKDGLPKIGYISRYCACFCHNGETEVIEWLEKRIEDRKQWRIEAIQKKRDEIWWFLEEYGWG